MKSHIISICILLAGLSIGCGIIDVSNESCDVLITLPVRTYLDTTMSDFCEIQYTDADIYLIYHDGSSVSPETLLTEVNVGDTARLQLQKHDKIRIKYSLYYIPGKPGIACEIKDKNHVREIKMNCLFDFEQPR